MRKIAHGNTLERCIPLTTETVLTIVLGLGFDGRFFVIFPP